MRSVFVDTIEKQKREKENFKSDVKTAIPKDSNHPTFEKLAHVPSLPKSREWGVIHVRND